MEKSTLRTIESIKNGMSSLSVVPITVDNLKIYLSLKSSDALPLLESLKIPYPRILESAHT